MLIARYFDAFRAKTPFHFQGNVHLELTVKHSVTSPIMVNMLNISRFSPRLLT
jgi:hypothetical protein